MKPFVVCENCGKKFQVPSYRKDTTRFCSMSCKGKGLYPSLKAKLASHRIDLHGNQFRKGLRPANAFTPNQVRGKNNPHWKDPIKRICIHCANEFDIKEWRLREKSHKGVFCSKKCRDEYRRINCSGPNHYWWEGKPSQYRGAKWTKQRIVIIEQQNGDCARCGKHVGRSLPVHHMKPFRSFSSADLANDPSNLIGLCQSCHMKDEFRFKKLRQGDENVS